MIHHRATLELLSKLKTEMPEIWKPAEVVGNWVWLSFTVPPLQEIREKLKELGFHWNHNRRCWQHPCGASRVCLNCGSRASPKACGNGHGIQSRFVAGMSVA